VVSVSGVVEFGKGVLNECVERPHKRAQIFGNLRKDHLAGDRINR
jgi:hypothetical protein